MKILDAKPFHRFTCRGCGSQLEAEISDVRAKSALDHSGDYDTAYKKLYLPCPVCGSLYELPREKCTDLAWEYVRSGKKGKEAKSGQASGLEQLWMVHLASSYYDNDSRMPGDVPVNHRFYVLASSQKEALDKTAATVGKTMDQQKLEKGRSRITAQPLPLEALIPARDTSNDPTQGNWYSHNKIATVELSHPDDCKRYRLAVCLVPADE